MPEPMVVSKYRWPVAVYDMEQNMTQLQFMDQKHCQDFLDAVEAQGHPFVKGYTSELSEKFRASNVYSHPECENCWAKFYCSGGCAANSYHATGSIDGVYEYGCRLFRHRMECAIMLNAARAEAAPEAAAEAAEEKE